MDLYHDTDSTTDVVSSSIVESPSQPYRDSLREDGLTPARSTSSWGDEDTVATSDDPLEPINNKLGDDVTLDLGFIKYDMYKTKARRRPWIIFIVACTAVLIVSLVSLDMLLRMSRSTWPVETEEEDDIFRNWGQGGTGTETLSWYPTNFLQDVIPKPIHSHNDYWRKVPLFTALRQGCMSVEADVWLIDGTNKLYVGHERAALQQNRTFESLYIQPLVEILKRANPTTDFYNDTYRGVFDTSPNETLTLLVDVKTAGAETWAEVVKQLDPLRQRNWLTYYSDGVVHTRPITVVGSGNTPPFVDPVSNNNNATPTTTYRDYFFDAPLVKLASDPSDHHYNTNNSFYASVSFASSIGNLWMGKLNADQLERIRYQVKQAHDRGLKVRYWDLPSWPIATRNMVWDVLVREGVDMLNVDDVKSAAKRQWR